MNIVGKGSFTCFTIRLTRQRVQGSYASRSLLDRHQQQQRGCIRLSGTSEGNTHRQHKIATRWFSSRTRSSQIPKISTVGTTLSGGGPSTVTFRPRNPVPDNASATNSLLVRVSAHHIAQAIDLNKAASIIMASHNKAERADTKNTAILKFANDTEESTPGSSTTTSSKIPQFAAIYPYGSLVCFNMTTSEVDAILRQVRAFTTPHKFQRQESFAVHIGNNNHPPLVTGDACRIPDLEWNAVAVVGNILAQSVALDSYSDTVNELLSNFATLNASVAASGQLTDKDGLFKTVAQNNAIFIDMISKIRILDRSDTAWNLVKYEGIHYGLKEEFEIDDRFENIEFKLNLIEKNAKFFLEVVHHQKSNNLEWIIVFLIALECMLMCVEMSGTGEALFQAWSRGELWP